MTNEELMLLGFAMDIINADHLDERDDLVMIIDSLREYLLDANYCEQNGVDGTLMMQLGVMR